MFWQIQFQRNLFLCNNNWSILSVTYRSDMAKVRPGGRMRPPQTSFAALELKYWIPHSQLFKKIWLFKPKYDILSQIMTFLKNILGTSCRKNFQNNFEPLYPLDICLMFGMKVWPREHSKLLKMAPE